MKADQDVEAAVPEGAISLGISGALITALTLALLDCAIAFAHGGDRFGHIYTVFEPLLATFTIALAGCFIVQILLALFVRPIFRLEGGSLTVAACALVGAALSIHFLSPWPPRQMTPAGIVHMGLTGFVLALIGIAAYLATRAVRGDTALARFLGATSLGLPLLMLEGSAYVWIQRYVIGGVGSASSIVAAVVAISVIGITMFSIGRAKSFRTLKALVMVMTGAAIAGPWVGMMLEPPPGADRTEPETTGHTPRHVILISVDTLRASALSCYGQDGSAPTPGIDSLAADGVLFENAISAAPWTLPSLTSLVTGIPPSSHEVRFVYSRAQDSLRTMPEYFRQKGYATAGFGNNAYLSPVFNVVQGFDEYQYFPNDSYRQSFGSRKLMEFFPQRFGQTTEPADLTDRATRWLRDNHERDFFLWLHYYDPHMPYAPPKEFLPPGDPPPRVGNSLAYDSAIGGRRIEFSQTEMEWVKELYNAEVRYTDSQINRFMETLKELGIYEDAVIIFTSDHGEEFWEHGGLEHGHSLYHELLWVPLILKFPGAVKGITVETRVSTMSVMPTMLKIAGIVAEPDTLAYSSLLPLTQSGLGDFTPYPVISSCVLKGAEDQEAIYFGDFKYIRTLQTFREELYDRKEDPTEQNSVARDRPALAKFGKSGLSAFYDKSVEWGRKQGIAAEGPTELPESTVERLRDLGYM